MRRALAAIALAALAGCAGLLLARGSAAHGSHAGVIRGAVVYQRLCASCHGQQGHGDGPRAADGLARPADLTTLGARQGGFDRRAVAALVDGDARPQAHGSADSPVWGDKGLRPDPGQPGVSREMEELLDYLEHSQGPG